ncbi:MAG TPA: YciI-like protein [Fimbriimonadales bacterium]|jgi:uncharacterized protein YciI|nr:YciI-like protein [Fimbriimonadales bacterium]
MHFLLIYDLVEDYLERRAALRADHLQLAWQAADRGELILGGAVQDPLDTAILLFKCASPQTVESFATADPYVTHGLVKSWRVRGWSTVVGETAAKPVRA